MALMWAPPAAVGVGLMGTTALIMGGTGQPFVNPFVREADVDGLPSYPFAQWGLTDASGQPAGYVADVLKHYITPNLPEGEGVTTKVVWNPNEIWPFIGTRTFDASVATGAAQLTNCLTSPSTCVSHIYPDGEAGDSNSFSIFGYSQSATAASQVKAALIEAAKVLSKLRGIVNLLIVDFDFAGIQHKQLGKVCRCAFDDLRLGRVRTLWCR